MRLPCASTSNLKDSTSRAEEIYHRLSLGQSPDLISSRWQSGIEDALRPAIDELQGAARTYLAARLDVDVDGIEWSATDQTTWEAYVASRAVRLLGLGRHAEALELLRRRSTRLSRSALFAIETQVLLASGQPREALRVAREGLSSWPSDPTLPPLIEQCQRVVGDVDVVGSPEFDADSVSYHLSIGVELDEVTSALTAALPARTDLVLVLHSLGMEAAEVPTSEHSVAMRMVVELFRRDGRLDQLVSAAAAYAPRSGSLQNFLNRHAAKINRRGASPLTSRLLPGRRPFFSRFPLRSFLRQLATGTPRYRILAVNGPAGAGKSYTAEFLDFVCQTSSLLEFVLIRPEHFGQSPQQVAREIHHRLSWRWEDAYENVTEARMIRSYAEMNSGESRATIEDDSSNV